MKRLLLLAAVVASCACAPEKPDTSVPEISITFVSVSGHDVGLVADIFDADGIADITSITCKTTTGGHTGTASINPNGTADCDITLPSGSWTIQMTITDKAGWTATDSDQENL